MPKGRQSNPSTENTGNWYKHSNCEDYLVVGPRASVTSTGNTYDTRGEKKSLVPAPPPPKFSQTSLDLYHTNNPFSYHDNRNNIQLTGEYFGNGTQTRNLGKRLTEDDKKLHKTEIGGFLRHHDRKQRDSFFCSNYMLSYDSKQAAPAQHRRFPLKYSKPAEGIIGLPTTTTEHEVLGEGQPPYRSTTQTLVSSLEPYLRENTWKYAYHRHRKHDVYPKVWGDRRAAHLPNSKPRPRPIIVNRVQRGCSNLQQLV